MKKGLKIVLLIVLILLLVATVFIVLKPFFANGKLFEGYYLCYKVNDDGETCTVTKQISLGTKVVIVPEKIAGYRVTEIGEYAFANRQHLTRISMPLGITTIGMGAFYKCSGLTEITIPKSVTSLGSYAFYGCSSLQSITLPQTLQTIGTGVFEACSGITTANIPASAIASLPAEAITSLVVNSGTDIGDYAFKNFKNLTDITISPSVEAMGKDVFQGCKNISSATIPTCAISEIPKNALTHVVINGGTHIPEKAFLYCANLSSVTILNSVQSIGNLAFRGCYKLVEVYNLSSIALTKGAVDNGGIGRYALNIYTSTEKKSKTWTDENGYLFFEDGEICYLLGYMGNETELVLPKNCNEKPYTIHQYAFYSNTNLTSVTIPTGVLGIDAYAFYHCSKLTSISFPNGLVSIGEYAFADCKKLTELSLGKDTMLIDASAFEDCNNLTRILFSGTTEEWRVISKDYHWLYDAPLKEVICTNGSILLQ